MVKGKISCGFEFKLDEKRLEGYSFQVLASRLRRAGDNAEPADFDRCLRLTLGDDQTDELLAFLDKKSSDGFATVEDVGNAWEEIIKSASEKSQTVKN